MKKSLFTLAFNSEQYFDRKIIISEYSIHSDGYMNNILQRVKIQNVNKQK